MSGYRPTIPVVTEQIASLKAYTKYHNYSALIGIGALSLAAKSMRYARTMIQSTPRKFAHVHWTIRITDASGSRVIGHIEPFRMARWRIDAMIVQSFLCILESACG